MDSGATQRLGPIQRVFAYLPFEHSEELTQQQRSVALYQALAASVDAAETDLFNNYCEFARKHHEIIQRFNRFSPTATKFWDAFPAMKRWLFSRNLGLRFKLAPAGPDTSRFTAALSAPPSRVRPVPEFDVQIATISINQRTLRVAEEDPQATRRNYDTFLKVEKGWLFFLTVHQCPPNF